jgi:saccharopine dehydrogenase (NAD+, L-lysine forming)
MNRVLIIGAGGVGGVVAHKCAQLRDVFHEIILASRTLARCEAVREEVKQLQGRDIQVRRVDADKLDEALSLLQETRPDLVIHVALPYQDLVLMEACLRAGVPYLDTANYEPRDVAKFEYRQQWDYGEKYRRAGLMALLGSGFDPGVTNVFCAYAQKHLLDEIHNVDIIDCNAGSHGRPFATNFNPEINLREVSANGRYWENGKWVETKPMERAQSFDFPEVGERKAYLIYHEELESLVRNLNGLRRIRFWMTFSDEYLTHLRVLGNVGLTRIDPVSYNGVPVVPVEFLKVLLPDPRSLGKDYTGRTSIGCLLEGVKSGQPRKYLLYNVADHAQAYKEVRANAVSYTTGVAAMVGAAMMTTGKWKRPGVINLEELDPDPFLDLMASAGLPWHVKRL